MKNSHITRRDLLKSAGAAALFGACFVSSSLRAAEAPQVEILSEKAVTETPDLYYGWPTVGVTKDDELLVAVSGGRETHVCPFGRVDLFRSRDKGETWSWPQTISDGPSDDRDAGILVTEKGTILVTTFTSLAYEGTLKQEIERRAKGEKQMSDERYDRWMKVYNRISEKERVRELGSFIFRSTDDGVNWEPRHRVPINSNHGPFQMKSGRLIYPGVEMWTEERAEFFAAEKASAGKETPSGNHVGVWYSDDDGQSWEFLSAIPTREGDDPNKYHELHGVEADDGTLIVQIRNHNARDDGSTLQCESTDGGKTWSQPHAIGFWGHPSHLWRLADGRVLMTYGFRSNPLGQCVRISDDSGRSWSEPYMFRTEVPRDNGYPSSVQLSDGSLVSVWYETPKDAANTIVKMVHWVLKN